MLETLQKKNSKEIMKNQTHILVERIKNNNLKNQRKWGLPHCVLDEYTLSFRSS